MAQCIRCGKPGNLRCSRCKAVNYCGCEEVRITDLIFFLIVIIFYFLTLIRASSACQVEHWKKCDVFSAISEDYNASYI
jgi:hypothetical protein